MAKGVYRKSKSGAIKTVADLRRGFKGGPRWDFEKEKKKVK